jgi:hypothetical protein
MRTSRRLRDQSTAAQACRQVVGWIKTVGGPRKLRHCGRELVDWQFTFIVTDRNRSH